MGDLVAISIDTREFDDFINNIRFKLPKEVNLESKRLTNKIASNIRATLTRKQLVWRGHIKDSIKAMSISENEHVVVIGEDALYLDRARPHRVSVLKHPEIKEWVQKSYKSPWVGKRTKFPAVIKVKPHPYLNVSIKKEMERIDDYYRQAVDRGMKK